MTGVKNNCVFAATLTTNVINLIVLQNIHPLNSTVYFTKSLPCTSPHSHTLSLSYVLKHTLSNVLTHLCAHQHMYSNSHTRTHKYVHMNKVFHNQAFSLSSSLSFLCLLMALNYHVLTHLMRLCDNIRA